jgi:hypothetical protein
MNAYFDSLVYMMIMMVVLFMFSFPAMYIYSNYNALRNEAMYTFTKFSLGNLGKRLYYLNLLGGSSTTCSSAPIDSGYLPLACKSGVLRTDLSKFGIIPESAPAQNLCMNDKNSLKCYPLLKEIDVLGLLKSTCDGLEKCVLNVTHIKHNYTTREAISN